jgi:hypothetical protein
VSSFKFFAVSGGEEAFVILRPIQSWQYAGNDRVYLQEKRRTAEFLVIDAEAVEEVRCENLCEESK